MTVNIFLSCIFYTNHLSKLVATLLPHTGWDIKMRSGRGMGVCGALSAVCTSCTYMERIGAQVQVGTGSGWQAQVQVRTGSGWQAQVEVRTGSGWQAQVQVRTGSGWRARQGWEQMSSISSTYIPSVTSLTCFANSWRKGHVDWEWTQSWSGSWIAPGTIVVRSLCIRLMPCPVLPLARRQGWWRHASSRAGQGAIRVRGERTTMVSWNIRFPGQDWVQPQPIRPLRQELAKHVTLHHTGNICWWYTTHLFPPLKHRYRWGRGQGGKKSCIKHNIKDLITALTGAARRSMTAVRRLPFVQHAWMPVRMIVLEKEEKKRRKWD